MVDRRNLVPPEYEEYMNRLEQLRKQGVAPRQLRDQMGRLVQQQYRSATQQLRSQFPNLYDEDGDVRDDNRAYRTGMNQIRAQREYQNQLARYNADVYNEKIRRDAGLRPSLSISGGPPRMEAGYAAPGQLPVNPFSGFFPENLLTGKAMKAQRNLTRLQEEAARGGNSRGAQEALQRKIDTATKASTETYKMFKKGGEVKKAVSTKKPTERTVTVKKKATSKMMDMEGRALKRKTADAKGRAMKKAMPVMPMGMKKGGAAKKKSMKKGC